MKPIDDPGEFQRIMAARNRIAASQRALSRKWISDTGVFAMAAEGIVHFVDDEYKLFADAFRAEAPGRLFGISNEDRPPGWDHAVMVEQSTEDELEQLETEFYGQYFCCSPRMSGTRCYLLRRITNSLPARCRFCTGSSRIFPHRSGSFSNSRMKSFPIGTLSGTNKPWKLLLGS